MRLIDADALIKNIIESAQDLRTLSTKTIGEAIHKTPTIEAYPCALCAYNHPSSGDGKPCAICPAVAKAEREEE